MSRYWPGILPDPSVRTLDDMRYVLASPDAAGTMPLYFMYRDLALTEDDRQWLAEQNVRFDITVIPPGIVGGEYVKTKGHYHPLTPAGIGYPELYQVLAGEAHYLLQRKDLRDVVVVTAKAAEFVLIPPGYGHVTINPGVEELVMANLVSAGVASEYAFYEQMQGGAYYEMEGGVWVRNPRYPAVPPLRVIAAVEVPELGIRHGRGIYEMVSQREDLAYLNAPEKIPDDFYKT
ncbi:glucose-6-phosphate isomerase [Methanoculleus taiwanensis]|uniref:glucose-6-phosphate isomerase n=1 Tax=Methanoculleus taiwanensis TaxID=1550565 RepID=A0A498GZW1_9EURY|nr:glucose-6-phosphate isomerase family protein [Methanoculleus taiwanensis]RXE55913.1 glucose-6-phosphate isomerase [Methanoculleus taiwanensis]